MDPFTVMMAIGLATQAVGAIGGMSANQDYNKSQTENIRLQQQVEAQRRKAMELDANRKQLENLRQVQRANALALSTATNQGAQRGSGLQGAYGQFAGQGNWNALGISQNLEIGENIFGLNSQISDQKINMANAHQQMQMWQGVSSLGGSISSTAGSFGRLTAQPEPGYYGGSPSNNPRLLSWDNPT